MITAVDFIALNTFTTLVPAPDLVVISIGDPAQMAPENLSEFARSLRMEFLDLEPAEVSHYGMPDEVLFSHEQALQLSDFVQALHAEPRAYRMVVHCRMGSSRSAAVALAVHKLTGCGFPRRPDAHFANRHVVELAARVTSTAIEVPRKLEGDEPHHYLPLQLQI